MLINQRLNEKGGIKMKTRGQGTIEYLVIIAIVVVIALVVVGLLLQIMSGFGGTGDTSAKISWQSGSPWAINDWQLTNNVLTIVLKNNTAETLHFNSISIGSDSNNTAISNIGPYATKNITIAYTCSTDSKYSFPKENIYIDYNKGSLANMRQNGFADIVGTCN